MNTVQEAPTVVTGSGVPQIIDQEPFLFTAEAFRRMIDADVFADDERVELWDGRVTTKMAKKIPHSYSSARLNSLLIQAVPRGWCVWPENPVEIGQVRVPLPDFTVLRGNLENYASKYPAAGDVVLIIELSDSSLRYDSTTKLAGYAEAGIPVYWVVNLVKNVIQTYAEPVPTERRYAREVTYAIGQSVPIHLDGTLIGEIPVLDLLPVRA